jgi:hypothetical protein
MYAVKRFRYGSPATPAVAASHSAANPLAGIKRRPLPPLAEVKLSRLRIDQLREALRLNAISFPGQVPVFEHHDRPDLQWRIAQLYYVLGWSCGDIAPRYGINRQRVGQILSSWTRRAVETGYIQIIPPASSAQRPVSQDLVLRPSSSPLLLTPSPAPRALKPVATY